MCSIEMKCRRTHGQEPETGAKKWKVSGTDSRGFAEGKAFILKRPALDAGKGVILPQDAAAETARFETAVKAVQAELERLAGLHEIFAAHSAMAGDIELREGVTERIRQRHLSAETALRETAEQYRKLFAQMDDCYMRERAADVEDVSRRIWCALQGVDDDPFQEMDGEYIVVAEEFLPSDIARLPRHRALGLISEKGSAFSHAAILARMWEIPCIWGAEGILKYICDGADISMDAASGEIALEPHTGKNPYMYQI